ncbi:hypothetical protein ET464_05345 [Paenibacillus protaetiae]|uniref:DUF7948 domain-containing protein n=1 Tax=Paenibacillus protaetiae TaxID=2509456 RepID=A0A4P6ESI0_9BACL|nr:hypothetical protein ET464_05345 [Paenibacillus protaetiae]
MKPDIFGQLPMYFVPNKGQFGHDMDIKLVMQSSNCRYSLLSREVVMTWCGIDMDISRQGVNIRLAFWNPEPNVSVVGCRRAAGAFHYLRGNDSDRHFTDIPLYHEAVYRHVWEGIDARLYSESGGLKFDWMLQPGADPSAIQLLITGAADVWLDDEGNLAAQTPYGLFQDAKPVAFQETDSGPCVIPCRFTLVPAADAEGWLVGFELEEGYNRFMPLIIDPELNFSTYLGGTGLDSTIMSSNTLEVTPQGNAILVGMSNAAATFPITPGVFQPVYGGGSLDITITKFTSDGSDILFSTFLGGDGTDIPRGWNLT